MGLFTCERVKKDERIARYYGELIGPEETARRRAAGAQYIVRANSKQFLDAEAYVRQRGRYANDGGVLNNARISTTVNTCPVTGMHWVSILTRRTIQPGREIYVPYGRDFKRSWRKKKANPAMMVTPIRQEESDTPHTDTASMMRQALGRMVAAATTMPRRAMNTRVNLFFKIRDRHVK